MILQADALKIPLDDKSVHSHNEAVNNFEHKAREIMANETHKCPKCGEPLKVKTRCSVTIEQLPTNGSKKKDPDEPMSIDEFINNARQSKQTHIQIIAEYADTIRKLRPEWESFTVRAEWQEFTKRNLRAATSLAPTWRTEEGKEKIGRVIEKIESNGYLKDFTLETILKELEKV